MKASALTTVMFIMQACYGPPIHEHQVQMSGIVVDKTTGLPLKDIEYAAGAAARAVGIYDGQYRLQRRRCGADDLHVLHENEGGELLNRGPDGHS